MATTTGTKTLTYPNESTLDWYATFAAFAQAITDYLDGLATSLELVNDLTPQLGGNLDLQGYDLVDANGNELVEFNESPAAVNYFLWTNASTGNNPVLSAVGDDTNIDITWTVKGTGVIPITGSLAAVADVNASDFDILDTNGNTLLGLTKITSAVNYGRVTNATTTNPPKISAVGDDANVNQTFTPKGTGQCVTNNGMTLAGDIYPASDASYDIGSSTAEFVNLYCDTLTWDGGTTTFGAQSFVKCWVFYDQSTNILEDSYNVASITDGATGEWSISIDDDMTNGNYVTCCMTSVANTGSVQNETSHNSTTIGTISMRSRSGTASSAYTLADLANNYVIVLGDRGE